MFDIEFYKSRYNLLVKERKAILEVLEPLQDALELAVSTKVDDTELRKEIVKVRKPLFDIDQEIAFLSRGFKATTHKLAGWK